MVFSLPNLSHTPIFWGFIDSKRNILTKPINTCWKLKPHIAHIYKRIRTCPSLTHPLILRHKKLHLYQLHNLIFRALWIPNQLVKVSIAQTPLPITKSFASLLIHHSHKILKIEFFAQLGPPHLHMGKDMCRFSGHQKGIIDAGHHHRQWTVVPFGWTDWAGHLLFLKPRD